MKQISIKNLGWIKDKDGKESYIDEDLFQEHPNKEKNIKLKEISDDEYKKMFLKGE